MSSIRPPRPGAGGLFRAGIALFGLVLLAGAAPARALEPGEFDPAPWDTLLHTYVTDGRVDYAAWKADGTGALDAFLEAAGDYDLTSTLGKEPRAAFLVNAYNAFAIRQILDHYPVGSVKEIPGFLDKNAIRIAGEERTLDGIKAALGKLLPTQPSYAFLIVPGTSGWPPLPGAALSSGNYRKMTDNARKEMVLGGHVYFDEKANVLHLPAQITDYIEVYDALPKGLVGFLSGELPLSQVVAISAKQPERVTDPVDWTLNDVKAEDAPADPGNEGESGQ